MGGEYHRVFTFLIIILRHLDYHESKQWRCRHIESLVALVVNDAVDLTVYQYRFCDTVRESFSLKPFLVCDFE